MSKPPAKGGNPSGKKPQPSRSDLRSHIRFRIEDATAKISVEGLLTSVGLRRADQGRAAVNLSEGGVLVLASKKLDPGDRVKVRIELERFNDAIEAKGEVCWCFQSARRPGDYFTGIRFLDLPPLQKSKIAKMRDWFTSAAFKHKSAMRRQQTGTDFELEQEL